MKGTGNEQRTWWTGIRRRLRGALGLHDVCISKFVQELAINGHDGGGTIAPNLAISNHGGLPILASLHWRQIFNRNFWSLYPGIRLGVRVFTSLVNALSY